MFWKRRPGEEPHAELNPTEARQGRWGRPVFVVLVVSVALATLALGGLTLFFTTSNGAPDTPPMAQEVQ
jgi:hypothetical protein